VTRRAAVTLVVAVVALTGAARADDAYRLGAVFPISGPMAVFGAAFRAGADLAVEHVRADRQLARPIEIRYEDSQGQVQPTLAAMTRLAREERLPCVLIGLASASRMVAPIVEREKVLALNGSATTPDLGRLSGYFWNLVPLADFELRQLLPVAQRQRAIKRLALVYVADLQGQALQRPLEAAVASQGIEVAGSFAVAPFDQDFAELGAKLRELDPDAIHIVAAGRQQIALLEQLHALGKPLLGSASFDDPELIRRPAADGALFAEQKFDWAARDPVTQRFVKDFTARTRQPPSAYAANYYNAVLVYAQALKALEARQVEPTGEAVREALQGIKRFDVVGGALELQPDGTVQLPVQVKRIADGAIHAVEP
jgi:ABC-type branched-subunit amino acid transport system substrate-binding protein